jgi:uncharacterized repeat protein (TIGR03803 family)
MVRSTQWLTSIAFFGALVFALPSGAATNLSYSGAREKVLYAFRGGTDGAYPEAGLIADSTGALYGTTYSGGSGGHGTVFKLSHSRRGYTNSILYSFQGCTPTPL